MFTYLTKLKLGDFKNGWEFSITFNAGYQNYGEFDLEFAIMSLSQRNFLSLEDRVKAVQMLESGRSSRIIAAEFNIGPINF